MSTSAKRVQANRENARKSTGPKTEQGKASSSRNSIKHGVLSEAMLAPGEDADVLAALLADLRAEHQPQTTLEALLVDRVAQIIWRTRRLAETERRTMQHEQAYADRIIANNKKISDYQVVRLPFGGLSLDQHNLIGRYQTMLDNQLAQTLELLERAKQERSNAAPIDADYEIVADDASEAPTA